MYVSGIRKSALTAMAELAKNYRNGPLNVADISENQQLSVSYIEQIFCQLRRARLVRGVRGPGGGYILSRQPADISIAEILDALDRNTDEAPVLDGVQNEIRNVLQQFTLARLIS